ncbi:MULTISPECIES: homoserine dehydrogenase [Hyphobacterium]|uniref:Homoserine dehydrogenase n=1 Tax=Hyphobacterium vulgare TaxID=1736751 RepID=A0ABV6ZW71_9PROT
MSLSLLVSSPASPTPFPRVLPERPLRAVLLGCGTVGGGVLDGIRQSLAGDVTVEAILVSRHRKGRAPGRFFTEAESVFAAGPRLVIDCLPDGELAERLLELALQSGADIVSANKAVIARRPDVAVRARERGQILRFSAAVGGELPVLETVSRVRGEGRAILAVAGVVNGTSNFVLDRLAEGAGLDTAIRAAQALGFAEADPSADLEGRDAAAKLTLIARAAFGRDPDSVTLEAIDAGTPGRVREAAACGYRLRQIAILRATNAGVEASVSLTPRAPGDPLGDVRDEENAVRISCEGGDTILLTGRGAGREATASSVLSDIRAVIAARCGR